MKCDHGMKHGPRIKSKQPPLTAKDIEKVLDDNTSKSTATLSFIFMTNFLDFSLSETITMTSTRTCTIIMIARLRFSFR